MLKSDDIGIMFTIKKNGEHTITVYDGNELTDVDDVSLESLVDIEVENYLRDYPELTSWVVGLAAYFERLAEKYRALAAQNISQPPV